MNNDFVYVPLDEDDEELVNGFDHSNVDSGENDDSCDFNEDDLSLGFIRYVGTERGKINIYEFIFTTNTDEFWGVNFEYKPSNLCNGIEPDEKYVQKIVKVRTIIKLDLLQDSGCFSIQDGLDGIVSIGYENLDEYEEYPEDGRIYFMFGESYYEVERKWAIKHVIFGGL